LVAAASITTPRTTMTGKLDHVFVKGLKYFTVKHCRLALPRWVKFVAFYEQLA
jgi:hypothetical protein